MLDGEGQWTFVQRNSIGKATYSHDIGTLPTPWRREHLLDGLIELGVAGRPMLRIPCLRTWYAQAPLLQTINEEEDVRQLLSSLA